MAREDLHFRLRIPEALKERIEAAAASNNRSMTAEIISRLEVSFEREADWENALENIADALARIEKLESQVEDLRYSTGSRDYAGNEDY
jgi:uncharacterized protein YaaN involved in tellurite resistance